MVMLSGEVRFRAEFEAGDGVGGEGKMRYWIVRSY